MLPGACALRPRHPLPGQIPVPEADSLQAGSGLRHKGRIPWCHLHEEARPGPPRLYWTQGSPAEKAYPFFSLSAFPCWWFPNLCSSCCCSRHYRFLLCYFQRFCSSPDYFLCRRFQRCCFFSNRFPCCRSRHCRFPGSSVCLQLPLKCLPPPMRLPLLKILLLPEHLPLPKRLPPPEHFLSLQCLPLLERLLHPAHLPLLKCLPSLKRLPPQKHLLSLTVRTPAQLPAGPAGL